MANQNPEEKRDKLVWSYLVRSYIVWVAQFEIELLNY